MSFEQRLNAGAEYEAAREEQKAARELLEEVSPDVATASPEAYEAGELVDAAYARAGEASMKFQEILLQSKGEVTPELVMEAYEGYSEVLREKIAAAAQRNDLQMIEQTLGTLKELERIHEHDERILPEADRAKVLELLDDNRIQNPRLRQIFMKRMEHLVVKEGNTSDAALSKVRAESQAPAPVARIDAGWTGLRKQRNV